MTPLPAYPVSTPAPTAGRAAPSAPIGDETGATDLDFAQLLGEQQVEATSSADVEVIPPTATPIQDEGGESEGENEHPEQDETVIASCLALMSATPAAIPPPPLPAPATGGDALLLPAVTQKKMADYPAGAPEQGASPAPAEALPRTKPEAVPVASPRIDLLPKAGAPQTANFPALEAVSQPAVEAPVATGVTAKILPTEKGVRAAGAEEAPISSVEDSELLALEPRKALEQPAPVNPAKTAEGITAPVVATEVAGSLKLDNATSETPLAQEEPGGATERGAAQEASGTPVAKTPIVMVSASPRSKFARPIKALAMARTPLPEAAPVLRSGNALAALVRNFHAAQTPAPSPRAEAPAKAAVSETELAAPIANTLHFATGQPGANRLEAPAALEAPQATVFREVHEAAARLRESGPDKMELQVRLHTGEEVTIKLQLSEGRVATTVRTDSDSLRQALQHSWSSQATAPGERSERVATPVFESAEAQAHSQDFSRQQQRREQPSPESGADHLPWPQAAKQSAKNPSAQSGTNTRRYA